VTLAALGISLQRLVELTFVPDPAAVWLARETIAHWNQRGAETSAGAAAVAAAGLAAFVEQCRACRWSRDVRQPEIDQLTRDAESAIGAACGRIETGCIRPLERLGVAGLDADALTDAAIAVWQLSPRPWFRRWPAMSRLLEAAELAGLHHDRALSAVVVRVAAEAAPASIAA
jgi:hypothetical protein